MRRLAGETGLATSDLIQLTGFKPNYYYVRMRLELGFSLSDLEALARALDVAPTSLLDDRPDPGGTLRVDGAELGQRLDRLLRTYGQGDGVGHLVDAVRQKVPGFTAQAWADLVEQDGTVPVDVEILAAIADYFGVDRRYLAEPVVDEAVERVKAELELQEALHEAGATAIAARSLGEASPTALRAIAAAIRTRPGG